MWIYQQYTAEDQKFQLENKWFDHLTPLAWFVKLQTKKNSRTFQGHFKHKSQFSRTKINSINRHSLTPFWLAKTFNGVNYDFYFFSHGWSHYFILLPLTPLCKMATVTGYDLQLHLKNKISFMHKKKLYPGFYVTREFYRFLDRGWAKFSSAK